MTVLSKPRDPLISQALADAMQWCAGKVIDDRPALAHAVRVALTIGEHVPHPGPDLIAAALLHDAPELAPPEVDLDVVLCFWYSREVHRIVRALQAEHQALDRLDPPVNVEDPPVLLASTADRIVAFGALLRRANASGDVQGFFAARPGLGVLLPYFWRYQQASVGLVPATMSSVVHGLLGTLTYIYTAQELPSC